MECLWKILLLVSILAVNVIRCQSLPSQDRNQEQLDQQQRDATTGDHEVAGSQQNVRLFQPAEVIGAAASVTPTETGSRPESGRSLRSSYYTGATNERLFTHSLFNKPYYGNAGYPGFYGGAGGYPTGGYFPQAGGYYPQQGGYPGQYYPGTNSLGGGFGGYGGGYPGYGGYGGFGG
ncbi:uncharacterized protein LOC129746847 isoform X2 [Uranotaenia lowii]|nr:uncharacterized protein LOC129746847 isoform X2 [Uranotaenia lowii]